MKIPQKHRMDIEEEQNIYANADPIYHPGIRTERKNTRREETPQDTGSNCVKSRSSRVCLALLCFLLLTAVIGLCAHIYRNNINYAHKNSNLTDELLTKIAILTKDGWIYYKSSFYFISSEKKNWSESRKDCLKREADLTIINDKQEQANVNTICGDDEVWVGLTDKDEEDRWKWTDGSPLTYAFWRTAEPNGGEENCVLTRSSGWIDHRCHEAYRWSCEKKM